MTLDDIIRAVARFVGGDTVTDHDVEVARQRVIAVLWFVAGAALDNLIAYLAGDSSFVPWRTLALTVLLQLVRGGGGLGVRRLKEDKT